MSPGDALAKGLVLGPPEAGESGRGVGVLGRNQDATRGGRARKWAPGQGVPMTLQVLDAQPGQPRPGQP